MRVLSAPPWLQCISINENIMTIGEERSIGTRESGHCMVAEVPFVTRSPSCTPIVKT